MSERPKKLTEAEFDREYVSAPSITIVSDQMQSSGGQRQRSVVLFRAAEGIHELWELHTGDMVRMSTYR
jgi:hypothetical protein